MSRGESRKQKPFAMKLKDLKINKQELSKLI